MLDIEFSKKFGSEVFENYQDAIEFINLKPDYSLLKFRNIAEILCRQLINKAELQCASKNIYEQIRFLSSSQVINDDLSDLFHKLRKLCNSAVHATISLENEHKVQFVKENEERHIENAKNARAIIVELLSHVAVLLNITSKFQKLEFAHIKYQDNKEMIFQGLVSKSYKAKLKAAIYCESLEEEIIKSSPMVTSDHDHANILSLKSHIRSFYEAAYKLSVNLNFSMRLKHSDLSDNEIIEKYCDLEALFKYAMTFFDDPEDSNISQEGVKFLKLSADRGHSEAMAFYGAYLYEDKNYNDSLKYLLKAEERGVPISNVMLCEYYKDGLACDVDNDLAFKYVSQGIELGCVEALFELAKAYYEGTFVSKNHIKSKQLLEQAIEKGSVRAFRYNFFKFDGGEQYLRDQMNNFARELKKIANPNLILPSSKVGRNDPCPCNSGKKYKKCCMGK